MRKKAILFLYRTTKWPIEAEKIIDFAKTHEELIIDSGGQKRNQMQQYLYVGHSTSSVAQSIKSINSITNTR